MSALHCVCDDTLHSWDQQRKTLRVFDLLLESTICSKPFPAKVLFSSWCVVRISREDFRYACMSSDGRQVSLFRLSTIISNREAQTALNMDNPVVWSTWYPHNTNIFITLDCLGRLHSHYLCDDDENDDHSKNISNEGDKKAVMSKLEHTFEHSMPSYVKCVSGGMQGLNFYALLDDGDVLAVNPLVILPCALPVNLLFGHSDQQQSSAWAKNLLKLHSEGQVDDSGLIRLYPFYKKNLEQAHFSEQFVSVTQGPLLVAPETEAVLGRARKLAAGRLQKGTNKIDVLVCFFQDGRLDVLLLLDDIGRRFAVNKSLLTGSNHVSSSASTLYCAGSLMFDGDKVKDAVFYQDELYVLTMRGSVYRLLLTEKDAIVKVSFLSNLSQACSDVLIIHQGRLLVSPYTFPFQWHNIHDSSPSLEAIDMAELTAQMMETMSLDSTLSALKNPMPSTCNLQAPADLTSAFLQPNLLTLPSLVVLAGCLNVWRRDCLLPLDASAKKLHLRARQMLAIAMRINSIKHRLLSHPNNRGTHNAGSITTNETDALQETIDALSSANVALQEVLLVNEKLKERILKLVDFGNSGQTQAKALSYASQIVRMSGIAHELHNRLILSHQKHQ